MMSDTVNIVPCLQLPVAAKALLLPTAAVAEIIPYNPSEVEVLPDVPTWFIGMLTWRGVQVPLTALESMASYLSWNGIVENAPESPKPLYIAVINRITKINSNMDVQKFRQYPFFAIRLLEAPKLFRVSAEMLSDANKNEMTDPRILMEATLEKETVTVPNLENVWTIIDTLPSRLQWLGKIVRRGGGSK